MEVQKEAQRIMTLSVWKMYHSRVQRGGMRLHRSLQLSLVMRSARELYLSARLEDEGDEEEGACAEHGAAETATAAEQREEIRACAPEPTALPERREAADACAEARVSLPERFEQAGACAETPEAASERFEDPQLERFEAPETVPEPSVVEPMEEEDAPAAAPRRRPAKPSRKRRSCTLSRRGAAEEAELVPSKKARLGEEGEAPPQPQEGAFPSLAKVLQSGIGGLLEGAPSPPGDCRGGAGVFSILVRAVVAF